MSAVLTVNAGSATLKAGLYRGQAPLATLLVDRVGGDAHLRARGADGATLADRALSPGTGQAGALDAVLSFLAEAFAGETVAAVGHRVVHGGAAFTAPVRLTPEVLAALEALAPLAPLHQPHNLAGVRAAMAAFPDVPQVACFDTAFHAGQPEVNARYALPRALFDRGIRRYGFHGLSCQHIAQVLAAEEPALAAGRVILAHLGSGASLCGMVAGRSVGSSMGFSALDGLPMGTRCGQIDPGVLLHLMAEGMDRAGIEDLLYRRSGLLGLSGLSADMRVLEASGTPGAEAAIAHFAARTRREVAAMAALTGGIDALVFTAGIGEHSARIRAEICAGLGWMGVALHPAANAAHAREIGVPGAPVRVLVIPTDEESVIAAAARAAIG